ncbi:MAG TPA: polyphosphate polymerase domain-containing protein [Bacteroidia bacterium]|nr:polyphosphate polymerase domain-containing protein [Bacteroidia bacterium]
MINAVLSELDLFETITLEEMDRVKLMDRTDLKFMFNAHQLADMLFDVCDKYKVLKVAGMFASRYETLYYDTPDFSFFRQHHNGKTNRYKIRLRRYVDSDQNFFEIKQKNNKGRTVKNRVRKKDLGKTISGRTAVFLHETTGMDPAHLEPKLWVNYTRVTLVNKLIDERITIDMDLEVKSGEGTHSFGDLVIVESKQARPVSTPFIQKLKENGIRAGGTSKYCLAVSTLIEGVKKNNFKEEIHNIDKIINDPHTA